MSLLSVKSMYFIAVPVFSCLGILYHGYFYAFHLFHVVVNNDILLRVIQSVTKNGISLLWVAALMVIVIYMYSLASFAFLRAHFDMGDGMFCQTSWQCFISSLRVGLMDSLGPALPPFTYGFFEPGLRIIFDLSFFILITTIGAGGFFFLEDCSIFYVFCVCVCVGSLFIYLFIFVINIASIRLVLILYFPKNFLQA